MSFYFRLQNLQYKFMFWWVDDSGQGAPKHPLAPTPTRLFCSKTLTLTYISYIMSITGHLYIYNLNLMKIDDT